MCELLFMPYDTLNDLRPVDDEEMWSMGAFFMSNYYFAFDLEEHMIGIAEIGDDVENIIYSKGEEQIPREVWWFMYLIPIFAMICCLSMYFCWVMELQRKNMIREQTKTVKYVQEKMNVAAILHQNLKSKIKTEDEKKEVLKNSLIAALMKKSAESQQHQSNQT
jgi:hypothetical protein